MKGGKAPAALLVLVCLLGSTALEAFPVITGVTPGLGAPGTSVDITGSDLGGTREVRFGTGVAIFSVVSTTEIAATVPLDATTGPISVSTSTGTAVTLGQFVVSPRVTDFTPASAPPGADVLIFGNNFEGATAVQFNGTNSSFSVTGPTQIRAAVPAAAASGPIRVITPAGSAVSSNRFLVVGHEPFINSFAPTNGAPGATITIEGVNFTGATAVKFNGLTASSFTVTAPSQIRAIVPAGASTGPISVTTSFGTGTNSVPFLVTTAPVITDFSPVAGPPGTTVTLTGDNFLRATAVSFGGKNATSFSVTAATQIHATVPTGATNGPVSVTTPLGTGSSLFPFNPTSAPVITDFFPTAGKVGDPVTLNGFNFSQVQSVKFGGAPAGFSVNASTQIRAVVPASATNGPVTVTSAAGSGTSPEPFLLLTGGPVISRFDPPAGSPGAIVTIDGLAFLGTTAVKFNGTNAAFLTVSDTQISAVVPPNATTGPIAITTAAGGTTSADLFVVSPRLASFTPQTGAAGTSVTILGTNLSELVSVEFNHVPAAFTNRSAGEVVAVVPVEATTGSISVTTPAGIVATTNLFAVLPKVVRFTPPNGPPGTQVTVGGTGFGDVTSVTFGNNASAPFMVNSATQLVALVPGNAVSGPITVTTSSGSASSAEPFIVGASADLAVVQTASTNSILETELLTYTVVVTNRGPSPASAVVLVDTLPGNVDLVSAKATPGTVTQSGGTLRADISAMATNFSATLTISVKALAAGPMSNTVQVSAKEQDPDTTNNSAELTTTVLSNPAVLQISRTARGELRLTWPVAATNFVLQSSATAASPQWKAVIVTPGVSGQQKVVTVPLSAGNSFFRLTRP